MPDTTLSRCIPCMIWPKLPTEVVEDFNYVDDEEFRTIRRKLARWTVDNAAALRDANPEPAPGFNNRIKMNWKILLAIADLAGGDWPKRARAAALELREEDGSEPTDRVKAVAAMEQLLRGREEITSAEVCATLTADPDFGVVRLSRQGANLTDSIRRFAPAVRDLHSSPASDEVREAEPPRLSRGAV